MSERKIYCKDCGTYVGIIRDAKLIKGLKFICPSCDQDNYSSTCDNYSSKKTSAFEDNDWTTIIGNMLKK